MTPVSGIASAFFFFLAVSAACAADPIKLRIASVSVPPSMHTLYMQVAHEEGIYKRNGLLVDGIIQLTSGPLVTQALTANQVDVADTDAEGVLNAAAAGFPLLAVSAPAQHLSYLIMVQPEIKDHALKMGLLPIDTPSVASLRVFVQTEITRWGKVVEQAGIAGSQ